MPPLTVRKFDFAKAAASFATFSGRQTCSTCAAPSASVTYDTRRLAWMIRPNRNRSTSIRPYGIALGHNGNLINTDALKQELFDSDRRHLNTESDSEVLLNVLAHELQRQQPRHLQPEHVFRAVDAVHGRCRGAYSAIALISGFGVLGFRDLNGIRPVVLGSRTSGGTTEYAIASESVALDVLDSVSSEI